MSPEVDIANCNLDIWQDSRWCLKEIAHKMSVKHSGRLSTFCTENSSLLLSSSILISSTKKPSMSNLFRKNKDISSFVIFSLI